MERYRRTTRRGAPPQEKTPLKERMIKQSIVCIIITVLIALVKIMDTVPTNKITDSVRDALYYTVDYEGTVQRIVSAINKLSRGTSDETQEASATN